MNAFGVFRFNREVHRGLRRVRRVLLLINSQNKETLCFNENAEFNGQIGDLNISALKKSNAMRSFGAFVVNSLLNTSSFNKNKIPMLSGHVICQNMQPKHSLLILIAGPYRSGINDDPARIHANVKAMTDMVQLIEHFDAILRIGGPSSWADEMVSAGRERGKTIFFDKSEIPLGFKKS